jgi:hypothetical protein
MTPFLTAAIDEMLPNAEPDGCRECGFSWEIDGRRALEVLRVAPERFEALLTAAARTSDRPPGAWSPSGYVWHVGDVVRAWSERLHTLNVDPAIPWAGFDPDELAAARHYDELPSVTAPWALARAIEAVQLVLDRLALTTRFTHPEWGEGTVTDAVAWMAHEVAHHELDVRRGLGAESRPATSG